MSFRTTPASRSATLRRIGTCSIVALLAAGCSDSDNDDSDAVTPPVDSPQPQPQPEPAPAPAPAPAPERVVLRGADLNNIGSPLLSLNPDGPGGSPNQSLRSGDMLEGGPTDDVLIGALGIDVLIGGDGDDILIGGTEDFNSSVDGDGLGADNRDRAFGGEGNDLFIWSPGDGSDFYDGGAGVDVIAFGLLGEERDSDSGTDGAPFFNVDPPGTDDSQNFDGIFLDPDTNLPMVSASESPGFCTVLDTSTNPSELAALSLDHLVRFRLRGVADAFDAGARTDDDGLRVGLSLRNVEYVVCTKRAFLDGVGIENVQVLDLTSTPATTTTLSALPEFVRQQIH